MTDASTPSLALDAATLLSHSAWLAKFARALVANEADIDDVVQQTLATALARPPRHSGNLRGWLGTVARNVVRSNARSDTARAAREVAVPLPPPVESPVEAVARAELRRKVVECVLALEEPYRSTVILRFFEEQDVGTIARLTKTGEDTVRTRIRRGVLRVRELLERKADEETHGTAHEGVAARALLLARLRDIAASADRPSIAGPGGSGGSPSAGARGFGRSLALQGARRAMVAAVVVGAAGTAWWWNESRRDQAPPSTTAASRAPTSTAPATDETIPPASAATSPSREAEAVAPTAPTPIPSPTPPSRFARRGTIRGVVTGPNGDPVEGAQVWAIEAPSHATEYRMPSFGDRAKSEAERDPTLRTLDPWISTRSDASGRFEIAGLSPIPGWTVGAYAPRVGANLSPILEFDRGHDELAADLKLSHGVALRCRVRDEAGAGIGTAPFVLHITDGKNESTQNFITQPIGADVGDLDLGFQCGDAFEFECKAPGFESTGRTKIVVTPEMHEKKIDVTLRRKPGTIVRGRIVDAAGQPVDLEKLLVARFARDSTSERAWKAAVWAVPPGDPSPSQRIEGRFDFDASTYEFVLPETFQGTLVLRIDKSTAGVVPLTDLAKPPDLPCLEERLPKIGVETTYAVLYVDAETQEPIDLEHQAILPQLSDGTTFAQILRPSSDLKHGLVRYRWSPGFAKVEPYIAGYALSLRIVEVPATEPREPLRVEVPPARGGVRGIALHADGSPCAKTRVAIFRRSPDGMVEASVPTVTNADGEFEFTSLAQGEHAVVVTGQPAEPAAVTHFVVADSFAEVEVCAKTGHATTFHLVSKPTSRPPPTPSFRIFDESGVTIENLGGDWKRLSKSKEEITLALADGHYTVAVDRDGDREAKVEFDVPAPGDAVEIPLEPRAK